MLPEGDDAPRFELPALADGDHRRVSIDDYLGEDVVILAFYPGDFNPACDEESDLDELDLFTMQKDVSVLGISADTLYSHAAFAAEYDLHVPLLSDTRRRVAQQYGVTFEDEVGQELIERAVFVVDHDGVIQYAWSTQDLTELPDSDAIKDAIADTGGDDTAFARYRVGHAHYTEGRRAFTSAMGSYQGSEWMLSQSDFKRAQEEFEEAAEHFDSAVRFVDDPDLSDYYDRAEQKATALWQAAEWLTESASEYSSGHGAEGQQLRDDAERPLETARDIGEPIDPDDWPPDLDADEDSESILPQEEEVETELAVDIDEADDTADGADVPETDDAAATDQSAPDDGDGSGEGEIDDAELEEIEAELTANQPDDPVGEELDETPTSMVDAPPGVDGPDEGNPDKDTTPGEGDIEGEIDDADLEALEADMEASQSAADAAQTDAADTESDPIDDEPFAGGTGGGLGVDDAGAGDAAPDANAGDAGDDDSVDSSSDLGIGDDGSGDVPPPGSGALEPTGGSSGATGNLEPNDDQSGGGSLEPADDGDVDDLADPEGASDDELDAIPEEEELEELDEPDGASDEDMAAIPTEDELVEGDDEDEGDDAAGSADEPAS